MSLSDQVPGGFDQFKSEFHRLHIEILATQVPDAITPRELNGIVREGIKNPTVWALLCHSIYSEDPNAPWEATFGAISKLLTSFRQKGIDPYGEAYNGPLIGHTPVAANSASTPGKEFKGLGAKRSLSTSRDSGGRFQKTQRTSNTETISKRTTSTSFSSPAPDKGKSRRESKCTRCWQVTTNHNYRNCTATKCICGQPLAAEQPICYNYENHSTNAKFTDHVPKMLARILEAYKRGSTGGSTSTTATSPATQTDSKNPVTTRSKSKKAARAMAATLAEELARIGVTGENLDREF